MTVTPTYGTLLAAINEIRTGWPATADWDEIRTLQSYLADDPSRLTTQLPEHVRQPVRVLMERLRAERGAGILPVAGISDAPCNGLALWTGVDLQG